MKASLRRSPFARVIALLRRIPVAIGVLLLIGAVGSCATFTFSYQALPVDAGPQVVQSSAKAHLLDGSTIVFPGGVTIGNDRVTGSGVRYDIQLNPLGSVTEIALDSVVAMESFNTETTEGLDAPLAVVLGIVGGGLGLVAMCLAWCGSCPTVYSDSAGVEVLEAEVFSYSIAPLFESRDIDRLAARIDERGEVRLRIRNEFPETHYINHLELIEVAHASAERVVPDPAGRPIVLAGPLPLQRAADRDGRDVAEVLWSRDSLVFTSSQSRIDSAIASDEAVQDHIELEVAVPPEAAQIGLHLRMRNSLLATVLFQDMMLGDRGARALDWLGQDLREIGPAVELGQWAADNLGMRISVFDGGEWREVASIGDEGPLAWADLAVVVPVSPGPSGAPVTIRLAFPADNWRIDQVSLFETARYTESRLVPLSSVVAPDGTEQPRILSQLASPDESYLVTSPGHSFEAVFRPGPDRPDALPQRERTFFLASQGYYVEWVRGSWLANGRVTEPFRPGPGTLAEALRRWSAYRETVEDQFHTSGFR